MKKVLFFFTALLLCLSNSITQEALKSTEEDYYDFLSLVGTVRKPTLGYRTLSDNYWEFTEDYEEEVYEETLDNEEEYLEARPEKKDRASKKINPWKSVNLAPKKSLYGNPKVLYKLYGPEWFSSYNTEVPFGQNDGALWQGRGYNTSITAGFRLEAYGLEITFKPLITFSENKDFETMGNVYNYSWVNDPDLYYKQVSNHTDNEYLLSLQVKNTARGNVDLVQRYGDSYVKDFDWGDTEIRYTWKNLTIGAGTQSPWLGPAVLNPMLGSNNASSYPKVDIGLRRTQIKIPFLGWNLGDIEGRIWTGYLTESEYYDENSTNDHNMLNAMSASYSPSFIPGFTIGLNRIFITKWKLKNLNYLLRLFTASKSNGNVDSDEDEDQKLAFYADWQFKKIGLELYGELGIDDFTSSEETNPFHTAIYTVGLKQYIPLPFYKVFPKLCKNWDVHSMLLFEWNNFEMSQDFQLQWPYLGYYQHGAIGQGYTQKGQILGAGSGYFGNSQYLAYKIFYPRGSTTFYFHRNCPNVNFALSQAVYQASQGGIEGDWLNRMYYAHYETYFDFGIKSNFFVTKSLNIDAGIDWINVYCWRYYGNIEKGSYRFSLNVKYNL